MIRKSIFLWLVAMLAILMAACSQDDLLNDGDSGGVSETTTSYLSVNLLSSDPTTSRADKGYEDGTAEENKVNKVRFYFFTGTGAAANVKLKDGEYVNYYDWSPASQSSSTDTNVGSKLSAQLVIETPKGDKLPTQIVAVINPTESVLSRGLATLKGLQNDYAAAGLTTGGKFVMFNSVYGNADATAEVCAVSIKDNNLAKTDELAKANPVIIHVERCVAKVTVEMAAGFDAITNMLALKNKDKDADGNEVALTIGGEQVYLKINGWKLAAETDKGNLVKKIDIANWKTSEISDWWNSYGNKRSCWAINAPDAANQYWSYNEITANGSKSALYTNENADNYGANNLNPTKVILSGTLCHEDGNPFTIVRHLGSYFPDTYSATESENLKELKKNILSQLASVAKYYWLDGETYKSITSEDIKIVAEDLDKVENTSAHDCFVYAQLTDGANNKSWYKQSNDGYTTAISTAIDDDLKNNVDKALVWREGKTYYYYEIIHHTDDSNKTFGVVRNHVYKTKVTKIAGLGTPVYNPDQAIYPEKPDPNDHYVAAQINTLSWHIVTDDYELEW